MGYEQLIRQADQILFEGWDFGVFRGRFVEAELSWEISKVLRHHMWRSSSDGPGGIGVTGYRYGDPETGGPQIGHVHDGHADFRFPREVRDGLIPTGRAIPHPAFPNSRTTGATGSRARKTWQEPWNCSA